MKKENYIAIQELKKVRSKLLSEIQDKQDLFDSGCYNDFADGVKTICEIIVWEIDKQIETLKGKEKEYRKQHKYLTKTGNYGRIRRQY